MPCGICNGTNGVEHTFREMMFGTRDEFAYFECAECGCIQIARMPERLEDYYPADYYSFSRSFSAPKLLSYRAHFQAARFFRPLRSTGGAAFRSVLRAMPKRGARILDVGCGSGDLVRILRSVGFEAQGIDPFIDEETACVRRSGLEEVAPGWDLIMFHHSLEHMPDQVAMLRCVRAKLSPGGIGLVRIPVANWAWRHYGKNWVQLDAPRHLAIHTPESFQHACERAGLRIYEAVFDSGAFQFTGSKLYQRDIPLKDAATVCFSSEERRSFRQRAEALNRKRLGDQAAFYLKAI